MKTNKKTPRVSTDINIRISKEAHKKLKIMAAQKGVNLKSMVELLVK